MRRSQRQQGSDRSPHSFRPKKRTGFGPHLLPGLARKPCAFDSAAECVEANASKGSDRSQHFFRPKKRTGLGPHLCPQIRGVPKDFGGYVRSSDCNATASPGHVRRNARIAGIIQWFARIRGVSPREATACALAGGQSESTSQPAEAPQRFQCQRPVGRQACAYLSADRKLVNEVVLSPDTDTQAATAGGRLQGSVMPATQAAR